MNPKYFPLPKTEQETVVVQEEDVQWFYDHLHFHEAYQITLIKAGTGTCFAGNSIERFEPGDIFVLGQNMPHLFRSDTIYYQNQSLKSQATTLFFSPKLINSLITSIPEGSKLEQQFFKFQKGFKLQCEHLSQKILNVKKQKGLGKIALLLQILDEILSADSKQTLTDGLYEEAKKEITYERINKVFSFSMKNFAEPISIEVVAQLVSMTPNAFCKYFKQRTRKTYISFLNDVRINNACQLLQHPDAIVSEVALQCGFNNFSNFNRQFQKRISMKPSIYRDLQQNKGQKG